MNDYDDDVEQFAIGDASLVRYYDPDSIILDFINCVDFSSNVDITSEKLEEFNNNYATMFETACIDVKEYRSGELVAVKLRTSWVPALIAYLRLKNGINYYDVVILNTGHVIETHSMNIRDMCNDFEVPRRYMRFSLMDILPAGMKERHYESWSVDACNELKILMLVASKIYVKMVAVKKLQNYERMFGNLYLRTSKQIIDVKAYLLKRNMAFEDQALFQRIHRLPVEGHSCCKNTPISTDMQNDDRWNLSRQIAEIEITDENLDEFLPDRWKIGGSEPLSQPQRESIRKQLVYESHIRFIPSPRISDDATNALNAVDSGKNDQFKGDMPVGNLDTTSVEEKADSTAMDRNAASFSETGLEETGCELVNKNKRTCSASFAASHVNKNGSASTVLPSTKPMCEGDMPVGNLDTTSVEEKADRTAMDRNAVSLSETGLEETGRQLVNRKKRTSSTSLAKSRVHKNGPASLPSAKPMCEEEDTKQTSAGNNMQPVLNAKMKLEIDKRLKFRRQLSVLANEAEEYDSFMTNHTVKMVSNEDSQKLKCLWK